MSFGGGVQSTALAMLSLTCDPRLLEVTNGRIPEMYLFADPGDERLATYQHVWEMAHLLTDEGFSFITTYCGSLMSSLIGDAENGSNTVSIPFWVQGPRGNPVPMRRGCTSTYKIDEITKAAKKYFGVRRKNGYRGGYLDSPVELWLGISYDEVQRMKESKVQWNKIAHPLIDMRWTRGHCLEYLDSLGISAPRSSCVYCPFHGSKEWREVKAHPEDWGRVLALDRALAEGFSQHGRMHGLKDRPFLTRHLQPIDTIDFTDYQLALFDDECFGVCGV